MRFTLLFSNLFLIQLATSGLGICGSVFALAFVSIMITLRKSRLMTVKVSRYILRSLKNLLQSSATNPIEYGVYLTSLLYCLFDIFMVTFFGNEIKLTSENLSYKLFACNWMDQSEGSKKYILILMEVLKRPQQLVIGIFPLDLDIFTTVS